MFKKPLTYTIKNNYNNIYNTSVKIIKATVLTGLFKPRLCIHKIQKINK